MPVNPEFAGRVYPPSAPYGVSAAKIKEFAEAVGATDPAHTDRAAAQARGYRDVIAPPTFAVLVAQRAEMEFIFDPRPESTSAASSTAKKPSSITVR
jgi:acyl dehydratase